MNNFPIGYQPYYQKPTNTRVWVQGEAGAKSYLVAPNTTIDLWDSEKPVIYVKSADASGLPTMRIIDYKVRESAPTETQNYVTHDEMEELKAYIESKFNEIGGDSDEE